MLQYKNKTWHQVDEDKNPELRNIHGVALDIEGLSWAEIFTKGGWIHTEDFGNEHGWGMKMYKRLREVGWEYIFESFDDFDDVYADNSGDAMDFIAHVTPSMIAQGVISNFGIDEDLILRLKVFLGDNHASFQLDQKQARERKQMEEAAAFREQKRLSKETKKPE